MPALTLTKKQREALGLRDDEPQKPDAAPPEPRPEPFADAMERFTNTLERAVRDGSAANMDAIAAQWKVLELMIDKFVAAMSREPVMHELEEWVAEDVEHDRNGNLKGFKIRQLK